MKKTLIIISLVLIVAQNVFAQVFLSHLQKTHEKHQNRKVEICCPFFISNDKLNSTKRFEVKFEQDIDSNKNKLNFPPSIVEIVAPDTMVLPDYGYITDTVFVQVSDPDSIEDVDSVWFYSLKPDSQAIGPFYLQNDGNGMFSLVFQLDASNSPGIYTWTFTARDLAGNLSYPEIHYITIVDSTQLYIDTEKTFKRSYKLSQNYPNPFNPVTTISYSLQKSGFVTLDIYDILGRKIKTLVNELQKANTYSVKFDASKLSSGIYFYKLLVGNEYSEIKKMMLMR